MTYADQLTARVMAWETRALAAKARLAERKQFAIDAINKLTYADDTDSVTPDLIAAVRAVAKLMPTDDADATVEEAADTLSHDMRLVAENTTEAWADEADYRYDMARDDAMMAGVR